MFRLDPPSTDWLSLGSNCTPASAMRDLGYNKGLENRLFDFLWNECGGLDTVADILTADFAGFGSHADCYEVRTDAITAWNGTVLSGYHQPKRYPGILFMHHDMTDPDKRASIERKAVRTRRIFQDNDTHTNFFYVRMYKGITDWERLRAEVSRFVQLMRAQYPAKPYRLYALLRATTHDLPDPTRDLSTGPVCYRCLYPPCGSNRHLMYNVEAWRAMLAEPAQPVAMPLDATDEV